MTTENIAFHTPCSEGVYLFISLPARHVTFATLSESRRMNLVVEIHYLGGDF